MTGRSAIVTGGAMGIGRACAEALLRAGAAVLLADVNQEAGRRAAAELAPLGRVAFELTDISRAADCQNAVAAALAHFERLDILVNNAGIQTYGDVVTTSEEIWDRTLNVNLKGHWLMSKAAVPEMLRQGRGAIVNISSVQGMASQRNVMAYSTSKHALIGLTRTMAVDLAAKGIRVNCVCPGSVDTPLLREAIRSGSDPRQLEEILNRMHPIGRIGRPEEIAAVVVFLAGDGASFMTGSIVTVDGGLMVPLPGSPVE